MGKRVLLSGASGMVGSLLLQQCLQSDEVSYVLSLVRKPSSIKHEKLKEIVVADFLSYKAESDELNGIDVSFCCIGVYTGAVSRDKFREITVDIPLKIAEQLYQYSSNAKFCLLSGAGADRSEKSNMMFAKDKGIVENQLSKIGFAAFQTFRPSYIYPVNPRNEPNFSYRFFRLLYPLIKLFGKNMSIKSTELAGGMFVVGMNENNQTEVFENSDILAQLKNG